MTLAPVRCPRAEMLHHLQCGVHSARLLRQLFSPTSTSQVGLARSFIGSCRSCNVCCRIQCQPSTRVPSLQPVAQEDSRGSWPSPEQKLLVVPPDNLRLHTSSPTTGPPRPRLSATQRPSGALSASAHHVKHRTATRVVSSTGRPAQPWGAWQTCGSLWTSPPAFHSLQRQHEKPLSAYASSQCGEYQINCLCLPLAAPPTESVPASCRTTLAGGVRLNGISV